MHKICWENYFQAVFQKKTSLSIPWDQESKVLYSMFLLCDEVEVYQNVRSIYWIL